MKKFYLIFGIFTLITMVSCLPKKKSSSVSSQSSYTETQKESSIPDGVSSACFCMDALSGGSIYDSTYEQKSKCRKMFICWDNAQADCLMGTSQVWYECIN
jgi:hypothetical protein